MRLVQLRRIPLGQTGCLVLRPGYLSAYLQDTVSTHVRAGPSLSEGGQSSNTRRICSYKVSISMILVCSAAPTGEYRLSRRRNSSTRLATSHEYRAGYGVLTHKNLANVVEPCHDHLMISRLCQRPFRSQILVIANISLR